jgi:hypothetical protein
LHTKTSIVNPWYKNLSFLAKNITNSIWLILKKKIKKIADTTKNENIADGIIELISKKAKGL